jgi:hypothetical protein
MSSIFRSARSSGVISLRGFRFLNNRVNRLPASHLAGQERCGRSLLQHAPPREPRQALP